MGQFLQRMGHLGSREDIEYNLQTSQGISSVPSNYVESRHHQKCIGRYRSTSHPPILVLSENSSKPNMNTTNFCDLAIVGLAVKKSQPVTKTLGELGQRGHVI